MIPAPIAPIPPPRWIPPKGWNPTAELEYKKAKSLARKLYPKHKPQSLNTLVLTPVSAVVNHAHQHGLCGPIKIARFAEEDARIARPIDREWLDQFRRHAPPHFGARALFCFTTGARPQEACDLRPDQLDLDRSIADSDQTKNRKRRLYYLVPEMVAILRNLPPCEISKGRRAGLRSDCPGLRPARPLGSIIAAGMKPAGIATLQKVLRGTALISRPPARLATSLPPWLLGATRKPSARRSLRTTSSAQNQRSPGRKGLKQ